jgi:hypothetical protein
MDRCTVRKLALLVLLAAPALAQDQVMEPSATPSETNTDCTTANAHTRNSDNSDATFCDGGNGSGAESYTLLFDFATPTSSPSTTTDAQQFACRFQKSATGDNPDVAMNFFCNGSSVESGATQSVTSTSPSTFTESFTFSTGSCAANGSDAQLEVNVTRTGGNPSGRRSVDSIDCDWNVTWAAASSRSRGHVIGD